MASSLDLATRGRAARFGLENRFSKCAAHDNGAERGMVKLSFPLSLLFLSWHCERNEEVVCKLDLDEYIFHCIRAFGSALSESQGKQ